MSEHRTTLQAGGVCSLRCRHGVSVRLAAAVDLDTSAALPQLRDGSGHGRLWRCVFGWHAFFTLVALAIAVVGRGRAVAAFG